jgi:hypothetical protein
MIRNELVITISHKNTLFGSDDKVHFPFRLLVDPELVFKKQIPASAQNMPLDVDGKSLITN